MPADTDDDYDDDSNDNKNNEDNNDEDNNNDLSLFHLYLTLISLVISFPSSYVIILYQLL